MPDIPITVGGRPATVPEEDLQQALDAGAQLARPAEAAKTATPGSLMGTLGEAYDTYMAFSQGGLRGATGGMGQALIYKGLKKISGEAAQAYKKEDEKLQQEHEIETGAGELAGLVAGSVLTPGGGAATTVAKGAAGGGLKAALTTIGKAAGEAAIQQAGYDANRAVSEAVLGDANLNAEKVFAAMTDKDVLWNEAKNLGTAAALGGGLAAVGMGGKVLWRSFKGPAPTSTLDAIANVSEAGRDLRNAAEDTQGAVERLKKAGLPDDQAAGMVADIEHSAKSKGGLTGALDSMVDSYITSQAPRAGGKADDVAGELRQLYEKGQATVREHDLHLDNIARQMQTHGDDVLRKAVDTVDDARYAMRAQQVERLAKGVDSDAALNAARTTVQQMREVMTLETGEVAMKKSLSEAEIRLSKIDPAAPNAASKAFLVIDDLKRNTGKAAKFGRTPFGLSPEAKLADRAYHQVIRPALEDHQVWGDIAKMQQAMNAADAEYITLSQQMRKRFGAAVLENDMGRPVFETDPGKFKSLLRSLDDASGAKDKELLERYLASVQNRADVAVQHLELGAADAKALQDGKAAATKMQGLLETSYTEARRINALDRRLETEHSLGLSGLKGLAADAYAAPYTTIQRLSQLRRLTETVDAGLNRALGGLFGKAPKGAASKIPTRTAQALQTEALAAKKMAGQPEALQARTAAVIPKELQRAAPNHTTAIAATMARAITYLAMRAPGGRQNAGLIVDSRQQPRISDAELAKYKRCSDAVHNPEKVLADAAQGHLNRDSVEALKFVYPSMYAQMQQMTWAHIAEMQEKGQLAKIPYSQKLMLQILLGVPAHETLEGKFVTGMQQTKQAAPDNSQSQQPQRPPAASSLNLNPGAYQTEADSISNPVR